MKKSERKAWKVAMLGREQSDKRLQKLQDAAIKGHEATEPSFRQSSRKPKRARKPDLNQLAARIVEQSTQIREASGHLIDEAVRRQQRSRDNQPEKNPAAVALGKLGGAKGGPARAKKLSAARRKAIASKAAKKRWSKVRGSRRQK